MQDKIIEIFESGNYLLAYKLIEGYEKSGEVFDYSKVDLLSMFERRWHNEFKLKLQLSNGQGVSMYHSVNKTNTRVIIRFHIDTGPYHQVYNMTQTICHLTNNYFNPKGFDASTNSLHLTLEQALQVIFHKYEELTETS